MLKFLLTLVLLSSGTFCFSEEKLKIFRKNPSYRNDLKNWDFDKEAPQNSCPERAPIAERQGASEGESFEVKPTQSKTDSSGRFGIDHLLGKTELSFDASDLDYLGAGNLNLLDHDYVAALENYEKVANFLDSLDTPEPTIEFFIAFGRIIAYDNLGQRRQCERAIGTLFLSMFKEGWNEDDDDDEFEEEESPEEHEEELNYFRQLAFLAPSIEVRELLLSLIDDEDSQ